LRKDWISFCFKYLSVICQSINAVSLALYAEIEGVFVINLSIHSLASSILSIGSSIM
jgi:hypothetical protein